eukprot:6162586-Amphidinium_carterae.1
MPLSHGSALGEPTLRNENKNCTKQSTAETLIADSSSPRTRLWFGVRFDMETCSPRCKVSCHIEGPKVAFVLLRCQRVDVPHDIKGRRVILNSLLKKQPAPYYDLAPLFSYFSYTWTVCARTGTDMLSSAAVRLK